MAEDTVILPALRGRTTKQSREHPPTNLNRPKAEPERKPEPGPAAPVPSDDLEKPARRGPSRALIGIGIAVVLVVAAAWLLVSLPGAPGRSDWAGASDRNWPPDAPGGSPSAELTPSAPTASVPFESPKPGQSPPEGLLPAAPARSGAPATAAAVVPDAAGNSPAGSPSVAPTGGTPTGSPMFEGGGTAPAQVEAEAFAWQWGVTAASLEGASGGRGVSGIGNGDWLRFDNLDLGSGGGRTLKVRIANGSGSGGRIEIRYDNPWAEPVASVSVDSTGGWAQWRTRSVSCPTSAGTHTVFLSFASRGSGDFVYLDWFSISG